MHRAALFLILPILLSVAPLASAQEVDPFAQLDADRDGAVTPAEAQDQAKKSFNDLDIDRDGQITRLEYTDHVKKMMEENAAPDDQRMRVERVLSKRFTEMDLDMDDRVSSDEFMKDTISQQDEMDIDDDGRVTKAEVDEVQKRRREKFHRERAEARKKHTVGTHTEPPLAPVE